MRKICTSTNRGTKLATSETVQYDFSDKCFREPDPSPIMFPQLLFFIQCFCSNYSCDRADRFGWVGNTKHGTTNISSSLYIQHMASWIPPPFARINFSSLIRATWRRDLVMFPAVFHCCQPVMNENSNSNASTMVMMMPTYLIFVIFLHGQNFCRIKFTPKNANFSR